MSPKLFFQALLKFLLGVVVVGALLFLPAGTFDYWNAWLLMGVLFIPMFIAGIVMMARNPSLLRSRLSAKEEQNDQRQVVALSGSMFIVGFVIAGLGYRFGWFVLLTWVSIVAAVVLLLAYALYAEVLRENTYLSRTVEVQQGQRVVDTGLYGIVRHPMYSATIVLFLAIPLVLGSLISFVLFLAYPFILAKRIRNEEEVLEAELPGYSDYMERVKYRLLPFIW